jgi:broad specificity phosphatase PhoE
MPYLYLIRHPRTHVDPTRPSHEWGLSDQGHAQVEELCSAPFCKVIQGIYASDQPKAVEAATAMGTMCGVSVTILVGLAEVGRGTETYLSAADYENALSRFFSFPEKSVAGWERAVDALARFQSTLEEIIKQRSGDTIAVVSHGMVLTLYTAMLDKEPPMLARWHDIDFATVAAVDVDKMERVTPFVAAPYSSIPLP